MHARKQIWLTSLAIAAASTAAWGGPERSADTDRTYAEAHRCYQKGDYPCALAKLKVVRNEVTGAEAYQVLFDIGQVHYAMGDWGRAARLFRRYLAEGGSRVLPGERERTERKLRDLEPRVAAVTVTTDLPGAEVLCDQESVGTTPLPEPILVNAGAHELAVRLRGYAEQSRVSTWAGGTRDRLAFKFAGTAAAPSASAISSSLPLPSTSLSSAGPSPSPSSERHDEPVPPKGPHLLGPVVAWSTTGLLAVGTTVSGILALSANSRHDDLIHQLPADPAAINAEKGRANNLATACNVLLAATVVAGGLSLWLTLDRPPSPNPSGRAAVKPAVSVGAGPSEVRLRLQF